MHMRILGQARRNGNRARPVAALAVALLAAACTTGPQRTALSTPPPPPPPTAVPNAYVYVIYGMHECLNLIAEPEGTPGCVLIRALEPVRGVAEMRKRRPQARNDLELTSGPAKLTKAMGITRALNGADVVTGPLVVEKQPERLVGKVHVTPRIGITKCVDWPLRFLIDPLPPNVVRRPH